MQRVVLLLSLPFRCRPRDNKQRNAFDSRVQLRTRHRPHDFLSSLLYVVGNMKNFPYCNLLINIIHSRYMVINFRGKQIICDLIKPENVDMQLSRRLKGRRKQLRHFMAHSDASM